MKLLATDLDRTLLPNGPAELSPGAMDAFIEQYTKTDSVQLAYVTGRNLRQVKDAQKEFGIPLPDFLLAEVGTKIFYKKDSVLVEDSSWDAYVLEQCPLWNVQSIVSVLKDLSLELQPEEFQNQFKISFFVHEDIQDAVVSLLQGTYDEEIIYSYDPLAKKGLIDIV
ncbi:MAG: HAD family hydrolase, partial [Candidatus Woesearchaeota archaeon]